MSAVVCLSRSPPSLSPLNFSPEPEGGAADVMFRIQCKWMPFTAALFHVQHNLLVTIKSVLRGRCISILNLENQIKD